MVLEFDLYRVHEQLKAACSRTSGDSPLHVFVAGLYADSAVALKILTDVLRSEAIKYSVFPVYGYDDIVTHASKGISSNLPYAAIFINCGGTEDLVRLLGAGPHARLFVIDCHRPVHLANIRRDNHKVLVAGSKEEDEDPFLARLQETGDALLADEGSGSDGGPSSDDDLGLDEDEDEDDEDEDDDSFEEVAGGGDGEGGKRRRRDRRRRRREGGDGDGLGGPDTQHNRQRRRAELRAHRRLRMEYYNRGSFYGRPAGSTLYDMAHLLRKDTSEHLWLACVAITDHFIHCRLPPELYTAACAQLEQKVNSLSGAAAPRQLMTEDGISVKLPDVSRIEFEQELRLMCLQRWNLFDSMVCSTYPCTKLKTWSEPGMRRVRLLFGEMGIGHSEAKQKFPYMSSKTRERLKGDLERFGPNHGMTEICFRAFQRSHGYKTRVSASDVVYGVTALLECGESTVTEQADNFWMSLSALDLRGWKTLEGGMDLAIRVQGAIVRQGSLALAKKSAIKTTFGRHKFQYLILEDSSDAGLLAHPLALTRLLHFLMDALGEQRQRLHPMVVAATPPSSNVSLIVGLPHRPVLGQMTGNKFGISFARAAESLGVGYRQEMFESSFLELGKAHVTTFMRILEEVMNDGSRAAYVGNGGPQMNGD